MMLNFWPNSSLVMLIKVTLIIKTNVYITGHTCHVVVVFQKADENPVEVISDDTDIAVLLLFHWTENMKDIFFHSERSNKTWSIKASSKSLSPEIKNILPLVHAFSGCDTTSAIFGLGKPTVLKQFKG